MKIILGLFCFLVSILCVVFSNRLIVDGENDDNKAFVIFGFVLLLSSIFACSLGVYSFVSAGVIVFI